MRIPITLDKPLGILFDEIPTDSFRRRALATLRDSFLIEDERTLKEAIATSTNSMNKSLLADAMNSKLLCWSSRFKDLEALRIQSENVHLDEALANLQNQIDLNKMPIKAGTSRETGFNQKFKLALRHAKRIEIIDPYAASNLAVLSPGPVWFLDRLIRNFDGVISIYSSEPTGVNMPGGVNGPRDLLEKNIEKLLMNFHEFKGSFRINLSNEVSKLHNRKLAISFDSGQATLVLEKGLAIFDADPLVEPWELANADISEYKNIIKSAANSRSRYEIEKTHTQLCEVCEN